VRNSPVLSRDPLGLYVVSVDGGAMCDSLSGRKPNCGLPAIEADATKPINRSGGRSIADGPKNGNWGGKCWSGGQYSCGKAGMGSAPPLDSGDEVYERHDRCHAAGGGSGCDAALVKELKNLPSDPARWPRPPRPGTEEQSARYRDYAIDYYAPPSPPAPGVFPW
jgi:hypothetical protein